MPANAQVVGLTGEMWVFLGRCWQENPRKRPTMEEVVRRWQNFVEQDNDHGITDDVVTECVRSSNASDFSFGSILNSL